MTTQWQGNVHNNITAISHTRHTVTQISLATARLCRLGICMSTTSTCDNTLRDLRPPDCSAKFITHVQKSKLHSGDLQHSQTGHQSNTFYSTTTANKVIPKTKTIDMGSTLSWFSSKHHYIPSSSGGIGLIRLHTLSTMSCHRPIYYTFQQTMLSSHCLYHVSCLQNRISTPRIPRNFLNNFCLNLENPWESKMGVSFHVRHIASWNHALQ